MLQAMNLHTDQREETRQQDAEEGLRGLFNVARDFDFPSILYKECVSCSTCHANETRFDRDCIFSAEVRLKRDIRGNQIFSAQQGCFDLEFMAPHPLHKVSYSRPNFRLGTGTQKFEGGGGLR